MGFRFQQHHFQQILDALWQVTITVFQFFLHVVIFFHGLDSGDFLIQIHALFLIFDIEIRQISVDIQIHCGFKCFCHRFAFQVLDFFFQQTAVHVITNRFHMSMLFRT